MNVSLVLLYRNQRFDTIFPQCMGPDGPGLPSALCPTILSHADLMQRDSDACQEQGTHEVHIGLPDGPEEMWHALRDALIPTPLRE
jgi:hypothetical protein